MVLQREGGGEEAKESIKNAVLKNCSISQRGKLITLCHPCLLSA